VRELTRALLVTDFGLQGWSCPADRLCPAVTSRLNYVLWVEDLLAARLGGAWAPLSKPTVGGGSGERCSPGRAPLGIDVGTGASAIYALLGASVAGWSVIGTEIDAASAHYAAYNVHRNALGSRIQVVEVVPAASAAWQTAGVLGQCAASSRLGASAAGRVRRRGEGTTDGGDAAAEAPPPDFDPVVEGCLTRVQTDSLVRAVVDEVAALAPEAARTAVARAAEVGPHPGFSARGDAASSGMVDDVVLWSARDSSGWTADSVLAAAAAAAPFSVAACTASESGVTAAGSTTTAISSGSAAGPGTCAPAALSSAASVDFIMCNPPFFSSVEEAAASVASNVRSAACAATPTEMVYFLGGEVGFTYKLLAESAALRTRVTWYTTLLGKRSSLPDVLAQLRKRGCPTVRTTAIYQGRTARWAVAWSWYPDTDFLAPGWVIRKAGAPWREPTRGRDAAVATAGSTAAATRSAVAAPAASAIAAHSAATTSAGVGGHAVGQARLTGSKRTHPEFEAHSGAPPAPAPHVETGGAARCNVRAFALPCAAVAAADGIAAAADGGAPSTGSLYTAVPGAADVDALRKALTEYEQPAPAATPRPVAPLSAAELCTRVTEALRSHDVAEPDRDAVFVAWPLDDEAPLAEPTAARSGAGCASSSVSRCSLHATRIDVADAVREAWPCTRCDVQLSSLLRLRGLALAPSIASAPAAAAPDPGVGAPAAGPSSTAVGDGSAPGSAAHARTQGLQPQFRFEVQVLLLEHGVACPSRPDGGSVAADADTAATALGVASLVAGDALHAREAFNRLADRLRRDVVRVSRKWRRAAAQHAIAKSQGQAP
jgi:23S rRNA A1618 N6-methylase RlmF